MKSNQSHTLHFELDSGLFQGLHKAGAVYARKGWTGSAALWTRGMNGSAGYADQDYKRHIGEILPQCPCFEKNLNVL